MLEAIITYLKSKLQSTNYFERVYGLCVLKENKQLQKIIPVYYKGKNEFDNVQKFDNYDGLAYFRKVGDVSIQKEESALYNPTSCDDVVKMTYPLKAVVCVPREKVSCDNEFADDLLCQTIIAELQSRTSVLSSHINALNTSILVSKYSTETMRILRDENGDNVTNDINYKFIYAAIEFNIELSIKKSCIGKECDAGY